MSKASERIGQVPAPRLAVGIRVLGSRTPRVFTGPRPAIEASQDRSAGADNPRRRKRTAKGNAGSYACPPGRRSPLVSGLSEAGVTVLEPAASGLTVLRRQAQGVDCRVHCRAAPQRVVISPSPCGSRAPMARPVKPPATPSEVRILLPPLTRFSARGEGSRPPGRRFPPRPAKTRPSWRSLARDWRTREHFPGDRATIRKDRAVTIDVGRFLRLRGAIISTLAAVPVDQAAMSGEALPTSYTRLRGKRSTSSPQRLAMSLRGCFRKIR